MKARRDSTRNVLTKEFVNSHFRIYKDVLVWLESRGSTRFTKAAGTLSRGRVMIQINGRSFNARDIVWVMFRGPLPPSGVKNLNGDLADNRIENIGPCVPDEYVSFM